MEEKKSLLKKPGFQTLLASVLCAILGIIIGFFILLAMNPEHAAEGMFAILRNFFKYSSNPTNLMYYLGSTLVKAVPLILCSEAILFAFKTGLFNIGCAGQYTQAFTQQSPFSGTGFSVYLQLSLQALSGELSVDSSKLTAT